MTHKIRWRSDDPVFRLAAALVAAAALSGYGPTAWQGSQPKSAFAAQVASLSEPDGYFDTGTSDRNADGDFNLDGDGNRDRNAGAAD